MLEDRDIAQLKDIFVTRKECDTVNDEINKKLANDNKELALIKQKLDSITFFSKTILTVLITAIIGAVLSLILRG